jgi:hypothetical protein
VLLQLVEILVRYGVGHLRGALRHPQGSALGLGEQRAGLVMPQRGFLGLGDADPAGGMRRKRHAIAAARHAARHLRDEVI